MRYEKTNRFNGGSDSTMFKQIVVFSQLCIHWSVRTHSQGKTISFNLQK